MILNDLAALSALQNPVVMRVKVSTIKRILHQRYLNDKEVRKAKMRKKRVNAKCGR